MGQEERRHHHINETVLLSDITNSLYIQALNLFICKFTNSDERSSFIRHTSNKAANFI